MEKTLSLSKIGAALLCFVLLLMLCISSIAEATPALILNETSITLVKGKTAKLNPSVTNVENARKLKYTWETSDNTVAAVTNGSVKGVNGGHALLAGLL